MVTSKRGDRVKEIAAEIAAGRPSLDPAQRSACTLLAKLSLRIDAPGPQDDVLKLSATMAELLGRLPLRHVEPDEEPLSFTLRIFEGGRQVEEWKDQRLLFKAPREPAVELLPPPERPKPSPDPDPPLPPAALVPMPSPYRKLLERMPPPRRGWGR